jgi:hypothetical protein
MQGKEPQASHIVGKCSITAGRNYFSALRSFHSIVFWIYYFCWKTQPSFKIFLSHYAQ